MTTNLRTGYTTGTCAAAASKASAIGLLTGTIPDTVEINTPIGKVLKLTILEKSLGGDFAECAVKKDAGDDPDVTHGCMVFARVERTEIQNPKSKIQIKGGEGVGIVTKPGLQIPPGEPAINPIPRRMIMDAVGAGLPRPYDAGLKVTISVPNGEKIAKRTFNPRLGILGGISIIGTTGIVKPMSDDAVKASLVLELDIARAFGFNTIVLVPGNIGEKAIMQWVGARCNVPLPREQVALMSNYVGFMLLEAAKKGFKKVMLAGHPGKLAKLIRGDFYTHSSKSESANNLIIDILNAENQVDTTIASSTSVIASEAKQSPTIEGIIEVLKKHGELSIFNTVANKIEDSALKFANKRLKVGIILFNMKCEPIGISRGAEDWQKELQRKSQ